VSGEVIMGDDQEGLKLGKGVAFVKTHLRRLPICEEIWEADFRWSIRPDGKHEPIWHGLVVSYDFGTLAERTIETPPTVNDMADLLARAMHRPYDAMPRRPHILRIRKRLIWQELLPHLQQVVQQVISAPRLAHWDKAFDEICRREAKHWPKRPKFGINDLFPNVAKFVSTTGCIEIGHQQGFGFVVRAVGDGCTVFEDRKAKTLAEALSALEEGLEDQLEK
jgi:hypothetical protein